ncbi:hypothetical protein ACA348_01995 [Orientia tsutsugamushi]
MIFKSKTKKYALHSAIQDGDIEKVQQLINKDSTLIQNIKTVLQLYLWL